MAHCVVEKLLWCLISRTDGNLFSKALTKALHREILSWKHSITKPRRNTAEAGPCIAIGQQRLSATKPSNGAGTVHRNKLLVAGCCWALYTARAREAASTPESQKVSSSFDGTVPAPSTEKLDIVLNSKGKTFKGFTLVFPEKPIEGEHGVEN